MCDQYHAVYINLERATHNREKFEAQDAFTTCGISRLDAVDGANTLPKEEDAVLKRGELGCIHSHMNAWRQAATATPYTVIFEDDFELGDYAMRVPSILTEASTACDGKPADIVLLNRKTWEDRNGEEKVSEQLQRARILHHGTYAYAISQEGAAKLLQRHDEDPQHFMKTPLDYYFHRYLHDEPESDQFCIVAAEPELGDHPWSDTSTTQEE